MTLLPEVKQRAGDRWRVPSRGTAAILSLRARLFIAVFLISFPLSVMAASVGAQFTSGVSLVEVYASAVDQRGEPVAGLTASDFVVEEDGRPQRIEAFSAGAFPLSLAIALDRSFSVPRRQLADSVAATERLLGQLRPDDRVMLMAIGSEVEVLAPLSTDRRAAYDAVRDLQPWGTTPLFDAAIRAIDAVQQAAGRRALILVSDGDDRYSEASAAAATAYAREHDVLVYPVALRPSPPPALVELAAVTGARSFAVADSRTLPSVLSTIASELRQQYLLGYAPADAARRGWRSLTVRVTRPGVRVRARNGYVVR
jgi:Ca-activated chloride channel family protein